MNSNRRLFWFVLLTGMVLSACSDDDMATMETGARQETAVEHAEKHLDPKYVCPMHP